MRDVLVTKAMIGLLFGGLSLSARSFMKPIPLNASCVISHVHVPSVPSAAPVDDSSGSDAVATGPAKTAAPVSGRETSRLMKT